MQPARACHSCKANFKPKNKYTQFLPSTVFRRSTKLSMHVKRSENKPVREAKNLRPHWILGAFSSKEAFSILCGPDQGVFIQGKVSISAGLIQSLAGNHVLLLGRGNAGTHEGSSRSTLGPVEGCSLHGGLTGVAKLLLPSRVNLVSILLEGQESTLDLLVGLGILNHTIAQANVAELAGLPLLPGLLTLTARDGTDLGGRPCDRKSHRRQSGSRWSVPGSRRRLASAGRSCHQR